VRLGKLSRTVEGLEVVECCCGGHGGERSRECRLLLLRWLKSWPERGVWQRSREAGTARDKRPGCCGELRY
jgi:hypothetical protein